MTKDEFVKIMIQAGFMPDVAEFIWDSRPPGVELYLTRDAVYDVAVATLLRFLEDDT